MTLMESIQSWAFAVCAAAVCGAVMNMLLPDGSEKRIFKTVLCLFMLCSILSPILSTDFSDLSTELDFGESSAQNGNITGELLSLSAEEVQSTIISDAAAALREKGIAADNISAEVNISPDGSINISRFSVAVSSGNPDEIKKIVEQKTGLSPEIEYRGENENGEG
mgnify:CR=1 FL=1